MSANYEYEDENDEGVFDRYGSNVDDAYDGGYDKGYSSGYAQAREIFSDQAALAERAAEELRAKVNGLLLKVAAAETTIRHQSDTYLSLQARVSRLENLARDHTRACGGCERCCEPEDDDDECYDCGHCEVCEAGGEDIP